MTYIKAVSAAIFLAGALASGTAAAHGGVRFGIGIGFPAYYPAYPAPYYYPPPAYYYPPPVAVAPAAPPVYIERGQEAGAAPDDGFWRYCRDSQSYYPYVQQCASEWERVPPRPPGR